MNSLKEIRKQIKYECGNLRNAPEWFYHDHLLTVEKFAKEILLKLPKANKEIVLLSVWLHDLQRIRGIKGDHQKIGAREARKVMREYGYSKEIVDKVAAAILCHSCSNRMPDSLEGKILASADAMSHYYNDFYLKIALTGKRDLKQYKEWVMEKLNRNYNKKIFFASAKKKIKARHGLFKKIFTLK